MRLAALALAIVCGCAPVIAPMGPPVIEPRLEDDRIVAADGLALPLRRWGPERPRAVILALHGFNDYAQAFAEPAAAWAAHGIATYAYDQRGFGAAPGRGLWPGAPTMVADLATASGLIARRHPGIPLHVAGESMGGAVAMIAAAQGVLTHADGVILAAPAVRGRQTLGALERGALWASAHTLPWLAGRPANLGIRPSDNIEMLRALGRDPMVIKDTRLDALWGLVELMGEALESARALRLPALILVGANDDLIPDRPTSLMLERLPADAAAVQRIAVYRDGYHMILRDLQAQVVHDDIVHWVFARAAGTPVSLPSGAERRAATGRLRLRGDFDSLRPRGGARSSVG